METVGTNLIPRLRNVNVGTVFEWLNQHDILQLKNMFNDTDFLGKPLMEQFLASFNPGLGVQMHLPTAASFISFFLLHFKRSQAQFSHSFPLMTQISLC